MKCESERCANEAISDAHFLCIGCAQLVSMMGAPEPAHPPVARAREVTRTTDSAMDPLNPASPLWWALFGE